MKINLTAQVENFQSITVLSNGMNSVAFSPVGDLLAAAGKNGQLFVFKWNAAAKEFGKYSVIPAHEGQIGSAVFDKQGKRLVSTGIFDRTTKVWDLTLFPPSCLATHEPMQDTVSWAAFSPDGKKIAQAGRTRSVEFLEAVPKKNESAQLASCYGHGDVIRKVIFTPTGHHAITASADATVRFWNTEMYKQIFSIPLPAKPFEVDVTPSQVRDFDFQCSDSTCLLAVPLNNSKMILYEMQGKF